MTRPHLARPTRRARRRPHPIIAIAVRVGLLLGASACSSDGGSDSRAGGPDPDATTPEGDPVTSTTPRSLSPVTEPVRLGSFANVVPAPTSVQPRAAAFMLRPETVIAVDGAVPDGQADDAVALLRSTVAPATGLELPVRPDADGWPAITFRGRPSGAEATAEAYELSVTEQGVEVTAGDHDGYVWAVQTLIQALPAEALAAERQDGTFALPAAAVTDAPRYAWRGAMLDVTRHFFGPDDVKTFIDQVSAYKLNRLHLHLSDDQGWRIEIRSHPDLARIGGASEVGGGEGGHYTQDEYRDLVAYAQERGVTVVPEIDTPGHTNAEPELTCDGIAPEVYTGMQVGFSTLCTSKESTYAWFDDVIGELAELTPGRWIHFGGDESHSTKDEDYKAFVTRAAKIVTDHGKVPVGWEEIAAADLPDEVVVQHWLHGEPAAQAAADGASIVMSPSSKAYLDMKHVEGGSGNVWAGIISTETAYGWDPATVVDGVPADRVLGVEAPLWTELIDDLETVQQRTLPRLPAIAEVGWTAQDDRAWDGFRTRIAAHAARWEQQGWAFTRDAGIDWPN